MPTDPAVWIRLLTMASLAGLLGAVGLRLSWAEVSGALRRAPVGWIVAANFAVVPVLAHGVVRLFDLEGAQAAGLALLAAAPFAPVVPVFARMARADLALAAGLTGLFPFLSAFVTPAVCAVALGWLDLEGQLEFRFLRILAVLLATITLPLAMGVLLRRLMPRLGALLLRPVEVLSEGAGALSLAFVTVVEWDAIRATGWKALLATAVLFELAFVLGLRLGGRDRGAGRVIAFGTSNRNIALGILVALDGFGGTEVVAAVVASGLAMIFLGLVHVAWWRWSPRAR